MISLYSITILAFWKALSVTALPRPSYHSKVSQGEHVTHQTSRQEDKGRRKGGGTSVPNAAVHRNVCEPGNFMSAKYQLGRQTGLSRDMFYPKKKKMKTAFRILSC